MRTTLTFYNHSNDSSNAQVVIFQKNAAADEDTVPVAWHVIQNCGQGEHHPFDYTDPVQISTSDSWGNYTPQLDAHPGERFEHSMSVSGDQLHRSGAGTGPNAIEVHNALPQGAINANIYRNGRMLACRTSIAPGQKVTFAFEPTLCIGLASHVEEGQVITQALLADFTHELGLLGVASADIVMTGGGPGMNSMPFDFQLQNVVMA